MAGEGEAVRMEWGPYSSCWGPGMRRLMTEGRLQDVTLVSMDRQNFPAHKVWHRGLYVAYCYRYYRETIELG